MLRAVSPAACPRRRFRIIRCAMRRWGLFARLWMSVKSRFRGARGQEWPCASLHGCTHGGPENGPSQSAAGRRDARTVGEKCVVTPCLRRLLVTHHDPVSDGKRSPNGPRRPLEHAVTLQSRSSCGLSATPGSAPPAHRLRSHPTRCATPCEYGWRCSARCRTRTRSPGPAGDSNARRAARDSPSTRS
jgi:hypothetical protein